MKMKREDARTFIYDELLPMVRVSTPRALHTLMESFDSLEIALMSDDNALVNTAANRISQIEGLLNGVHIAQCITKKFSD